MSKNIHFALQEVTEDNLEWVEIIRKGKFDHSFFGKFDINEDVLKQFKANFDNKAMRVDIAIDYFHDAYAEAAGWFKEIKLEDDGKKLFARIEWTDKAKAKIKAKEIKYISAEFTLDYQDSETGKEYGAALFGAGITNRPHVKDMQPIFSETIFNNKDRVNNMADLKDVLKSIATFTDAEKIQIGEALGLKANTEAETKTLSDAKALAEAKTLAETKLADKTADAVLLTDTVKKLSTEIKTLTESNAKQVKEATFNAMFTNGKVVEAQRVSFMANDFATFAEKAVAGINLEGAGSGENPADAEADIAVKSFSEKCSALVKSDGISFSEAAKIVTN